MVTKIDDKREIFRIIKVVFFSTGHKKIFKMFLLIKFNIFAGL